MLKFALVGCGRICYKHISALQEHPEAQIVAVCDTDLTKAKTKGEEIGVPYFENYHEMLRAVPTDVVCILTESGLHAPIALDIVTHHSVHLVIEKPMALRLCDADKMIEACDNKGVKLFVVKQNRYNKPVQKLKEAVLAGRFGKIVLGTIRVRWCRPQSYYDQAAWRGTWAYDGGVFTNQASHHVDLLQWMMGPVESVFAKTATMLANIETEDTGIAVLKFQSGALGVIEATTCARPKDLEGSISILGENGTIEIGGFAVNEMKTWQFKDQNEADEAILKDCSVAPPNVYGFGHQAFFNHIIDCIKTNKKSLLDGFEGRKSLELINAIYESAETGKEVHLHFKPEHCKLGLLS